ncbi:MAG: acyclic terpene utilization AtuA family protein [Pirellulaceae bacterium]
MAATAACRAKRSWRNSHRDGCWRRLAADVGSGRIRPPTLPARELDTGEPLSSLASRVVSANAYFGARPIASALAQNARIVITGRVADASLTVGPVMHEFGWAWDDWDRLAAATLLAFDRMRAQATGGYSTSWADVNLFDIGYPIAELTADGKVVITKPAGSGGSVTRQTIAEQLVYEIGDPVAYLTPDVTADFQHVELQQIGADRVSFGCAAGVRRRTPTKSRWLTKTDIWPAASCWLGAGLRGEGRTLAELILHRVAQAGYKLKRTHVELLAARRRVACHRLT